MIEIQIPGLRTLRVQTLVLDFNGTMACDGKLLPGVSERLCELSRNLDVVVVTADTYGTVGRELDGLPMTIGNLAERVSASVDEDEAKARLVRSFKADVVFIGNGRNDAPAMRAAALGIVLIQAECAATSALVAADIASTCIENALDLLLKPKRLIASLRV
ncbi:ATPase P [Oceanidesulfovibrio indonesiensis]|uniref:ATPase P n=1 Tax=Oceanidesulfovibrio indonesiensis TaxID=54767 RepID=A0A7M3MD74_9BACT|nr:HAD family hydrolase [Oceanidesulfovibrio indonesiensis]TVM16166.1 ATPase P [Oceanidesulfovibrio indonesiensis]